MRPTQYKSPSILPNPSYTKIRGTWDPNNHMPTLTTAGDAWLVCNNGNGYEVGDWIIRDSTNTAFTHISGNMFSRLVDTLGRMIDRVRNSFNISIENVEKKCLGMVKVEMTKAHNENNELRLMIEELRSKITVLENHHE